MKIIKAIIEGVLEIPQSNEPYKNESLFIHKITHYYEDGSFEYYFNSLFGNTIDDEFYTILPNDCEVKLDIRNVIKSDEYYKDNDFKRACYNREISNPYQLPKWTTL